MKQDKVFAVVKKAGAGSEIRLIEKNPRILNELAEGKRELIPFPAVRGLGVAFDGEAKEKGKQPNCFLPEYNDLLLGTVVITGINTETGFVSLTEEQAEKIEEYLKANDAKDFNGNVEEKIASGYLPPSEENALFSMLSEIKTKHKAMKFKWLSRR
ncbi:MAG: DUF3846 domain-containing protein [Clostridiales bacterium]|jgi:hypothetical protein|nr:DUF3846 domain-containing protein [Clostridiales bacterium]